MKKFIQYYVEEVDKFSPLNKNYYGAVSWFDGKDIIIHESPTMNTRDDCWKWIAKELKKI